MSVTAPERETDTIAGSRIKGELRDELINLCGKATVYMLLLGYTVEAQTLSEAICRVEVERVELLLKGYLAKVHEHRRLCFSPDATVAYTVLQNALSAVSRLEPTEI